MGDLAVRNQTQQITILQESTRRLERAAADERKPVLPATRAGCEALLAAFDADEVRPAGDEKVGEMLAKLQVHYWRPDFTPAMAASLYADLMDDLEEYSEGLLLEAIRDYRRDPEAKFFPRSGSLIPFIEGANWRRVRARFNLVKALEGPNKKGDEPKLPTLDRRKELADMARKSARGLGMSNPSDLPPAVKSGGVE